jgi:hypothetical protein
MSPLREVASFSSSSPPYSSSLPSPSSPSSASSSSSSSGPAVAPTGPAPPAAAPAAAPAWDWPPGIRFSAAARALGARLWHEPYPWRIVVNELKVIAGGNQHSFYFILIALKNLLLLLSFIDVLSLYFFFRLVLCVSSRLLSFLCL